ncbi:MAG: TIGR03557 family F420-dependent LLM class oxidoreductase [Candidatus Saccharimonadales bacterium]
MSKFYWFLGHEAFQPEVLVRHAAKAEKAGFDGVMVSEHFQPWVADVGASGFAFSTLGAIAQATKKVELMTAVTTPLYRYHPAVVAQAAATIDRLSGGRFALGIGNGEKINEAPLGLNFPAYKERAARLTEAIEIMGPLLAGEKLSYDGEYYQTKDAKLYSPPIAKVPIFVAAGGPQTASLTGRMADGLIASVKSPSQTLEQVINPAKAAAGPKAFTIITTHWSVYAQNNDEAWQALKAWRGLRAPSRNEATDPLVLQQEADKMPREDILSRYDILQSAQAYINCYALLVKALHADIVGFQATAVDQEALIAMVGNKVLPELRKLN